MNTKEAFIQKLKDECENFAKHPKCSDEDMAIFLAISVTLWEQHVEIMKLKHRIEVLEGARR